MRKQTDDMAAADDVFAGWNIHARSLASLLDDHFSGQSRVEILEGGCGSATHVRLPETAHVVGIDISPQQLARNTHIHERILGDLQTYEHPPERFDAALCWDVLEHIPDPSAALDRIARAVRPGGLLVLGFPDRQSLKGWLTRVLPFPVHIWVYRYALGSKHAGTQDHGPFPTPMCPDMDRKAVIARMQAGGFTVLTDITYESPMMIHLRRRFGLIGARWGLLVRLLRAITRERLALETSDCILVFRKARTS